MPNVYIIGDSISMGYTPVVADNCSKWRANVILQSRQFSIHFVWDFAISKNGWGMRSMI